MKLINLLNSHPLTPEYCIAACCSMPSRFEINAQPPDLPVVANLEETLTSGY